MNESESEKSEEIKNRTPKEIVERIYKNYGDMIYGIALKILRDRSRAEDAAHETIIRIMRYSDKLTELGGVQAKNYIARIARNTCIDLRNRINRDDSATAYAEDMDIIEAENTDPEEYVISGENVRIIADELRRMDKKYRDPLTLQKFNKHSIKEISEILGVSERTVNYRIERAKKILKDSLKKGDGGDEK